jgi:hypothetical protein
MGSSRESEAAAMSDDNWQQQIEQDEQQQLETENEHEQPSTARIFGNLPCDF